MSLTVHTLTVNTVLTIDQASFMISNGGWICKPKCSVMKAQWTQLECDFFWIDMCIWAQEMSMQSYRKTEGPVRQLWAIYNLQVSFNVNFCEVKMTIWNSFFWDKYMYLGTRNVRAKLWRDRETSAPVGSCVRAIYDESFSIWNQATICTCLFGGFPFQPHELAIAVLVLCHLSVPCSGSSPLSLELEPCDPVRLAVAHFIL